MLPSRRHAALLISCLLVLTACTDSAPPASPQTTAPGPTTTQVPTARELSTRDRAAQLTALAPEAFDATYRLQTRGKRPDAKVRMRARGERFRLDVARHRTTALLLASPSGIVSCRVKDVKKGKNKRSCFLVAKTLKNLPALFDPQLQRLFRSTTKRLSRNHNGLTVKPAKSWKAPKQYGVAECFDVRGKGLSRGTYCYLAKPGPLIGLLARVKFPSGNLELRSVKRVIREGTFRPPVRPTPLPK